LAALLGGVLVIIADLLNLVTLQSGDFSQVATTGTYAFISALYPLAAMLLLGGLVGLYVHQSEAAGTLGFVGFLLAFFGTAMVVGLGWAQLFVAPNVAEVAPQSLDASIWPSGLSLAVTIVPWVLGLLLFGLATLRARVYPRAAAMVLMVGAVILLLPLPLINVVTGIGVAWLGFVLFTGKTAAEQPSRVS
jgi:hypothetical protein